MQASEIYAVLSKHGLTPEIHFLAAPNEWHEALREIEELSEQPPILFEIEIETTPAPDFNLDLIRQ